MRTSKTRRGENKQRRIKESERASEARDRTVRTVAVLRRVASSLCPLLGSLTCVPPTRHHHLHPPPPPPDPSPPHHPHPTTIIASTRLTGGGGRGGSIVTRPKTRSVTAHHDHRHSTSRPLDRPDPSVMTTSPAITTTTVPRLTTRATLITATVSTVIATTATRISSTGSAFASPHHVSPTTHTSSTWDHGHRGHGPSSSHPNRC